eukprot:16381_1
MKAIQLESVKYLYGHFLVIHAFMSELKDVGILMEMFLHMLSLYMVFGGCDCGRGEYSVSLLLLYCLSHCYYAHQKRYYYYIIKKVYLVLYFNIKNYKTSITRKRTI